MVSYNSTIKRYTPPTCTLEIKAEKSFLGRLRKQKIPAQHQFILHFDDPRQSEEKQVTIEGDRTQLELLYQTVNKYIHNFLNKPNIPINLTPEKTESHPYLEPKNLVKHQLYFGSLAPKNSVNNIQLTVSQLFDLANALDDYSTDLISLNQFEYPANNNIFKSLGTILIAAGIVIGGLIWTNHNKTQQVSQTPKTQSENTLPQPTIIPIQPINPSLPLPPSKTSIPAPQLPPDLSSRVKLTPPSPINPNQQPPPITIPPIQIPIRSNQPPQTQPNPSNLSVTPVTPVTPSESKETISNQSPTIKFPPPPPIINAEKNNNQLESRDLEISQEPHNSQPSSLPTFSRENLDISPPINNQINNNNERDNQESRNSPKVTVAPSIDNNQLRDSSNINQLTEAKNYFQTRWQPPANLKKTIEYNLIINSDGTIKQIIPLGQTSKVYLDRTNMPLLGESFVSPLELGNSLEIRLVLNPDGSVQTFKD